MTMAEGLKLVNKLTERVHEKLPIMMSQADLYLVMGITILLLDEDDRVRKMMMDYLEDSRVSKL